MDEEKPAGNTETTALEISKDVQLLTDSQDDLKNVDVLVCGGCHATYYFLAEFQAHKADKCPKISKLQSQCENEPFSQVWAFTLWKNAQIRIKATQNAGQTTSSWEMYQDWCNLTQSSKQPWIEAGKSIQSQSNLISSKIIKNEVDPLALDNNKAYRTIKEPEKAEKIEYVVEKIVAKRFNPRRRTFEYQIKWENFESEQNTWEPVANLSSCKKMVEEFDENLRAIKAAEKLKQAQSKGRGRGRGGVNSAIKTIFNDLTPGRPVRTSKQKALDQVKQWCGNISEGDESGTKRQYDDADDSDDSFEKKMKFDEYSDDSDIEFKSEQVKKVFTKPVTMQLNHNNGVAKKVPQNVLIPDANGVVRINQKQLPSLSSGVYIMSKTAGIIRLDSSTSKVATSGGQTIVKVAPKIGQTQIKIVRKEPQKVAPQQKIAPKASPVTFIRKVEERKTVATTKIDEESDDGLEEMEFPKEIVLPEPESPPSEFVLDPTTGKLAGHEYEEKEMNASSLENIVKLAAADITEEDLKPIVETTNEPLLAQQPTVVVVKTQPATVVATQPNTVTNSMNILHRSLTAAPKAKSTPRILNAARAQSTIHTSPRALNQASPIVRTTKIIRQPAIQRVIPPRPRFNITNQQQSPQITRVYSRQPSTVRTIYKTAQTQHTQHQQRPQARIIQTNVYKASPRKETTTTPVVQQQVVQQQTQQKKAIISMPSLVDEQPKQQQQQVAPPVEQVAKQEEKPVEAEPQKQKAEENNEEGVKNDFSFTLADQENPIYITGDDGTVYQVAGQNEQGQTILITQDSNGQQQCLLVTNESVQDENAESSEQQMNEEKVDEEAESKVEEEERKSVEEPLSIKTDQNSSDQVIAQVVRAEPPSPGGTHKVVVMLPNGSLMVTQVTAEEYASLELD